MVFMQPHHGFPGLPSQHSLLPRILWQERCTGTRRANTSNFKCCVVYSPDGWITPSHFWGIIIYPQWQRVNRTRSYQKSFPYMFHLSWNSAFCAVLSGTSFVTKLLISDLWGPWVTEDGNSLRIYCHWQSPGWPSEKRAVIAFRRLG